MATFALMFNSISQRKQKIYIFMWAFLTFKTGFLGKNDYLGGRVLQGGRKAEKTEKSYKLGALSKEDTTFKKSA
jgi:hypothetical protein